MDILIGLTLWVACLFVAILVMALHNPENDDSKSFWPIYLTVAFFFLYILK